MNLSCLMPGRWPELLQRVGLKTCVGLSLLVGLVAGVGLFTFGYAEGLSYFSTDPKACVNCHIMRDEYDSWQKSSHHAHAACVDCHLPHDFIPKMIAKADNGYRHSNAFTFQNFHEPIQLIKRSSAILQKNCERCHADFVCEILQRGPNESDRANCVKCHMSVGHSLRR
jgi:cytochrome c nitrite reductase small subunit